MKVLNQLFSALNRMVVTDIKNQRTNGFYHISSRDVLCGSEHAFRLPIGLCCGDIKLDPLVASVGAPVELIDRGGAIVVRVVKKDFPKNLKLIETDIKTSEILIGYNRILQPIYHPLNTHLLVGGQSGSGKTDALRFWIYQLLKQGYEVRIADLKGFSFFPFETVPGVTIAKSLGEARDMLIGSYVDLMERKNKVIQTRDRDLTKTFKPVVVIIDEAAALAPNQNRGKAKKLAEDCDEVISYFGQQAREPRMFMIYSTQRPSVDVINMQFRANVEAMISFRTRDKYNSSLIIGKEGAERISPFAPGRCIYAFDRDYHLQVPYVGDDTQWNKRLASLKTEVLEHGSSTRSQPSRTYIEGTITRSDCDHQTNQHIKPIAGSAKESQQFTQRTGKGKAGQRRVPQTRKDMATDQAGTHTAERVSDEII